MRLVVRVVGGFVLFEIVVAFRRRLMRSRSCHRFGMVGGSRRGFGRSYL